ncbi:MAG: cation:proton antiporter [Chloroflexi bacterium]|nr:cation:proton antiporter [Chloroflexota bacterium]
MGLSLLGAAVFDDVLIILLLSIFLAVQGGTGGTASVLLTILRMFLFLLVSMFVGLKVLPWILHRTTRLPISQGTLTISIVIMLLYGIAAELFGGMAAITGSFIAGLMLARTPEKERIEVGVHTLAYALFVPIFFVNIGLSIDLRSFQMESLLFSALITLGAVAGKWIGSGWGARLGGLTGVEAAQLGAGMISRGEVGLIVASVGIQSGLMTGNEFSAVVVMILFTTLVTPPILRSLFAREKAKAEHPSLNAGQVSAESEAQKLEES